MQKLRSVLYGAIERTLNVKVLPKAHYLLRDQDLEPVFMAIYQRCAPYTMTSIERMYALYSALGYVLAKQIPGALVECGVWRGGSMMLAAETLKAAGETSRHLYLYDTFEGMPELTSKDIDYMGLSPTHWFKPDRKENALAVSLETVKTNLDRTGYPRERIQFVKGKVEDTIPATIPDTIALLRLDTDWYESTYHELVHLYPRLVPGGILILDDYGHWQGAREAVDQYFRENNIRLLLHRIDYTGRIGLKLND